MRVRVGRNISAPSGCITWITRTSNDSSGESDCRIDPLRIAWDTGLESRIQVPDEGRRRDQWRVCFSGGQVDARRRTGEVGEIEDFGRVTSFDYGR